MERSELNTQEIYVLAYERYVRLLKGIEDIDPDTIGKVELKAKLELCKRNFDYNNAFIEGYFLCEKKNGLDIFDDDDDDSPSE